MTVIRPIIAEDRDVWRLLWRDYLTFYETELPELVYETTFARLIDPSVRDYQGLLALRDGVPLGFAHFLFHRHGWQVEEVCYLQDLYVTPEARGTGAGRALIEAVFAEADAAGTPKVYWTTQEFNTVARRLYDRVGKVTPFIKYVR